MRKISYPLVMLMILFVAAGCTSAAKKTVLVGQVNGQGISQTEYDHMLNLQKALYEQQNGGKLPEDQATTKNLQDGAFNQLVSENLLIQEAGKRGITINDQDVSAALAQFQTGLDYQKLLKDTGLSEADLKTILKNELLAQKTYGDMGQKSPVSDSEISAYYKEHQADYKTEAGLEIYHILVTTEAQAQDILNKLKSGGNFAQLAKEFSQDPGSKDNGGYTGIANDNSQWVAEFKDAALKLKPGEIAPQPVKSEYGYHIMKAGKQVAAGQKSLAEVQNDIRTALQEQKAAQALQDLRQKADVKDLRSTK